LFTYISVPVIFEPLCTRILSLLKSWNNKIMGVENSEVHNKEIFYLTAFKKSEIPFCNLHDYVYLSSVTSQAIQ